MERNNFYEYYSYQISSRHLSRVKSNSKIVDQRPTRAPPSLLTWCECLDSCNHGESLQNPQFFPTIFHCTISPALSTTLLSASASLSRLSYQRARFPGSFILVSYQPEDAASLRERVSRASNDLQTFQTSRYQLRRGACKFYPFASGRI